MMTRMTQRSLIQAITSTYIYKKIFAGLKSLNLTSNQLYLKKLPEEPNDKHQKERKHSFLRDLSEISRGGGRGVETEGGSQLFETAEKGGVMKNDAIVSVMFQ